MDISIGLVELLLLISGLVAMLVRRLHLPYSVGLVVAGIAASALLFQRYPSISFSSELITYVFLPPLVFEAAFELDWPALRRDMPVIQALSILGVALSALLTAAGMHWALGWQWISALLFGALIAATDPVSVIATFKEAGVGGRARLLVEAESLFNDGTAAVLFGVVLAAYGGTHPGVFAIGASFLLMTLGSVACGLLVGGAMLGLITRTQDHLVKVTFTMTAAYGAFLMAQTLDLSGVLATLTAGLVMGRLRTRDKVSRHGRDVIESVLEYTTFLANSFIFLYIGIEEAHQHFWTLWQPVVAAIVLVLAGRAAAVYPCCLLFAGSARKVEMRHQHVLFWGGLRGALALALVLSLPAGVPHRHEMITACFAVVAFSIFVQGTTMTRLLRTLKIF